MIFLCRDAQYRMDEKFFALRLCECFIKIVFMKKGFIALSTVFILLVVTVSIVSTVTVLSIGESRAGHALFQGENTLRFSEGCAEDALLHVRNDESYAGGDLARPDGVCEIIASHDGSSWTIEVGPVSAEYVRRIRILCERNVSGITVTSWQEIE